MVELKGTLPLEEAGAPVAKRYVLHYPGSRWNGALVIGAHGGSGGNNFDQTGSVITVVSPVREAFGRLIGRVERGEAPPSRPTVTPGHPLASATCASQP